MRALLVLFLATALGATIALGEETTTAGTTQKKPAATKKNVVHLSGKPNKAEAEKESDSPLVKASKSTPAGRKKATISINNDTVKKSKGKLTIVKGSSSDVDDATLAEQRKKEEEYEKNLAEWEKSVDDNKQQVERLESEIEELKTVVGSFEEDFYNEDDPGIREGLEGKYQNSNDRLQKAQEELSAARQREQELAESRPRL